MILPQTACVLRMLESVIGRDAMKAGLRKMLREYKFKNIDGGLIWEELEKVRGEPIPRGK